MFIEKTKDRFIDAYLGIKGKFDICPFGPEYQKYWDRRKGIFSKWDRGVQTDAVGLFSATPEKIANEIAQTLKFRTVVDAFCGIGATAIAFAKVCDKVYAVDNNRERLEMAKANARIYKVENKIEFVDSDIFLALPRFKAEAVFLDPPWGGTSYLKLNDFKLKDFNPDGKLLLEAAFQNYPKVILRVPRQFNIWDLKQFRHEFKVRDNYIRSKLYSRTVYFD
jgi:trimethylguanosine synthase